MIQITCTQIVNVVSTLLVSLPEHMHKSQWYLDAGTDKGEPTITKAIVRECTFTLTIKKDYLKKHPIEEYVSWARQELKNVLNTGAESSVISPNSLTIKTALSKRDFNIAINLLNAKFQYALEGLEAHQEKKSS
jgi:hypothetical protein